MRYLTAPQRFLVILLVVCAFAGAVMHHHEAGSPESHCAICHFVSGLGLLATLVAGLFVRPQVSAWLLSQPPQSARAGLGLAACGLRAPPAVL